MALICVRMHVFKLCAIIRQHREVGGEVREGLFFFACFGIVVARIVTGKQGGSQCVVHSCCMARRSGVWGFKIGIWSYMLGQITIDYQAKLL